MSCQQAPPKAVLDLSGSSLYSKATIAFAGISVFFHCLGIFTDNWCHLTLSGHRFTVGLWRGCTERAPKIWNCSRRYARSNVFGGNWGVGPQVLITIALILLILVELLVLGYTCLIRLIPYRIRLLECSFGICIIAGVLTLIGLILFGTEIYKYPEDTNARIAWSFGMCVLSLLFIMATTGLVFLDRKLESYDTSSQTESLFLEPVCEETRY